jgi:hypothetical protein
MGGLAEGAGELAAEVRRRHGGCPRHVGDRQCLEVPGIDQILGSEERARRGSPIEGRQELVAIRSRFSTDRSSMVTGTTGHVNPERISSEALDQSQ